MNHSVLSVSQRILVVVMCCILLVGKPTGSSVMNANISGDIAEEYTKEDDMTIYEWIKLPKWEQEEYQYSVIDLKAMNGTFDTCVAVFKSGKAADEAANRLNKTHNDSMGMPRYIVAEREELPPE